ncbi:serine-threonine protein kinase 19-domain-containing protein [Sphaerosporella brunnea]|uniref:Serine-threonine protein kinase 19-domain-containing protein n=1 Tax=Sphaerosporella brunnea TaxID=1250544 RepID=A0A5J5EKN7_9PEZI|nr:serine-threonine protein kinase 19-domain-containing protein [Sphaerosporella brunnea]
MPSRPQYSLGAPSSRISFKRSKSAPGPLPKPRPSPPTRRSTPSVRQRKLQDTGAHIPACVLLLQHHSPRPTTVQAAITHVQKNLFSPFPENFKGLSSAQVAETAAFRDRIPPYVPVALLNALLNAPTATAREIARLCEAGELRRVLLPNRERGDDGGVVPTEYLYTLIRESSVTEKVKEKLVEVLKKNPTAAELPGCFFSKEEVRTLLDAGFLTLPTQSTASPLGLQEAGKKSTLTSMSAVAASGSAAAVGGKGIVTQMGYGTLITEKSPAAAEEAGEYVVSLPNLGPLLALLGSARERWEGQGGVSVGRIKRWKEFRGLGWEAVVGESLGRGDCEVFEVAGSGLGVRLRA